MSPTPTLLVMGTTLTLTPTLDPHAHHARARDRYDVVLNPQLKTLDGRQEAMANAPLAELLGDQPDSWAYDGNKILYTARKLEVGHRPAPSPESRQEPPDPNPNSRCRRAARGTRLATALSTPNPETEPEPRCPRAARAGARGTTAR